MFQHACAMDSWFRARGIKKGDRVTILAEGSPEWVITECGALLAGAISVPLSIKLIPEEMAFRLNHSEGKFIAISHLPLEKFLEALPEVNHPLRILYLDETGEEFFVQLEKRGVGRERGYLFFTSTEEGVAGVSQAASFKESISEDDVVTISYTSGTTPKAIMLTHKNYYTNSQDSVEISQVPYLQFTQRKGPVPRPPGTWKS